jgi:hypothetical protein
MPRKKKPVEPREDKPAFHEGLKGFDIRVNTFGEMESTFEIDKLNAFLNKEVPDKKLGKKTDEEEREDEENEDEENGEEENDEEENDNEEIISDEEE